MNHFILTYYNIHKLILAAFILAIKYNEDNYYSMVYYSKIGGVPVAELNKLEFEYFFLNYQININYNKKCLTLKYKLFYFF